MDSQAQQDSISQAAHGRERSNGRADYHSRNHIVGDRAELGLAPCKPKAKKPRMFKVILLNDNYTPMEFVVRILQRFFRLNHKEATSIMLEVHNRGRGVCGVFSREIAETKVVSVNRHSRSQKHPLLCVMEPDADAG